MTKKTYKVYICGKILGSGEVIETKGHSYQSKKSCENYCKKLNSKNPKFIYRVLVADNWRLADE